MEPCDEADLVVLSDPGQVSPDTFNYDGYPRTFTYREFTVSPSWCQFDVTCKGVTGPSQYLDCTGHELEDSKTAWSFDGSDYEQGLTPGTYIYTYEVSVGDKKVEFTVDLVLEDPCVNAQITVPDTEEIEYVITTPAKIEPLRPKFSVIPSFCATDIVSSVTGGGIDVPFDKDT